jgi:hypothetical protein
MSRELDRLITGRREGDASRRLRRGRREVECSPLGRQARRWGRGPGTVESEVIVMRFLTYEGLHPGDLSAKVERVRAAIERDDFRSPDVKKLGVASYYRAKLDGANRLLLQFVEAGGQKACLALEVIRQHAYDRSRFLRGAPVDEARIDAEPPAPPEPRPLRYLHPTRAEFLHLDKPLSLDDAQDEALSKRCPLVVVGSAGSGKTALLLERLRRVPGRVAYITESRWLAETARSLYVAFDGAPLDQDQADFLSYQQLLETIEVPRGRPVAFRDFLAFFERHRQKVHFADAHQCFEEIRGVLTAEPEGPLARDQYLALGVRQSMFDEPQRAALYDVFERYRAWLPEAGLYEPNLVARECLERVQPAYDFVAIDEVQDLTNVQLALVLRALARPGQFVVAGDANQIVHPNFFSWSKVKSLFWRGLGDAGACEVHVLGVSYRNSEAVTRAANRILRLKQGRFGSIDRESNELMKPVPGERGSVRAFALASPAVRELDEKTRQSTRVAVVVLREEHKAEARQRFRTPLVFSIHEAKGLEYETVILYRLVGSERKLYAELAEGVSPADLESDEALEYRRAKDKADRSGELYKFFVNSLYVGITRAVREVLLVEDDLAHPLLTLLDVARADNADDVNAERASAEEWQKEAHRLEAQGKSEQAEAIRATVLRVAPVPWQPMDRDGAADVAAKALAPGSVSNKAKQRLYEFACFHEECALAERLVHEAGFDQARQIKLQGAAIRQRLLAPYAGKKLKDALADTERYGVDFRTPTGVTPLMAAAYACNVPLVEALLERGASREARDHLGRAAMHWVLRRAYAEEEETSALLGTTWDLVAPPSFDVDVDGRLVQIGREQAEFFIFSVMVARLSDLFRWRTGRYEGVTAAFLRENGFEAFPNVMVKPARKRREYVNGVLARAEACASYRPARRLWVRERLGHYVPNPALLLRVRQADGSEAWRPMFEVLNAAWLDAQLTPDARGRLSGVPVPGELPEPVRAA